MTETTQIEATEQPPQALPHISQLHAILDRVQDEPADPTEARQVAYHLNRQRAVVSHSSRALQEAELTLEDLDQIRQVLIRRNRRVVAEIEDIDRAINAQQATIAALRGGT
jgi:hypothetical protein